MDPTRLQRGGRLDAAGGTTCFLAQFSDKPCSGRLVRCHLLRRQTLARRGLSRLIPRRETWVWGCGGLTGSQAHHGELDQSKTLRVPRDRIPEATERLAEEFDLVWWLDKTYGEVRS